jgi:IS30 family transposase
MLANFAFAVGLYINRRPREKLNFDTPKNRFFANVG